MLSALCGWWGKVLCRRSRLRRGRLSRGRRLHVEWLEDRTLLSGDTLLTAAAPDFGPLNTAQVSGRLTGPGDVDLLRVHLAAGERLSAGVDAQGQGSGLQSVLRVFDAVGNQVALDDREGGDPSLTFQAATAGDYYVGVSSAANDSYDPRVTGDGPIPLPPGSGPAAFVGLFTLDLRLTPLDPGGQAAPDLAGSSFRVGTAPAFGNQSPLAVAYGDQVAATFTLENRGGAAVADGAFTARVVLSPDSGFSGSVQPLGQPIPVPGLAPGASFAQGLTVTLPQGTDLPPGFPSSGPVYLGLQLTPAGGTASGPGLDGASLHRGTTWEQLQVVVPVDAGELNRVPAGTPVLGAADLGRAQPLGDLNSAVSGTVPPGEADLYRFSVPAAGRLDARAAADGGDPLQPRLSLYDSNGRLLVSADAGSRQPAAVLSQHLEPGTYYLAVSGQAAGGNYRLTTEFVQASTPFAPVAAGKGPKSVAVADVNGDGIPDLVLADAGSLDVTTGQVVGGGVSVLLGDGSGSFGPARDFAAGDSPSAVAVADVNGDGIPDLVVANRGTFDVTTGQVVGGGVSVLLGDGSGSFGPARFFAAGRYPSAVAVADVNGDGIPDLVVANAGTFDVTTGQVVGGGVSVLLGDGSGSFGPARDFAAGDSPSWVAVADVNGDGIPDLVVADRGTYPTFAGTVSVLLGDGHGSFGAARDFAAGNAPDSVAVADVNGDGIPDLVVADAGTSPTSAGTVSVLLGDGSGSFGAARDFAAGASPSAVAVADVNGDGIPDLVVANGALAGTVSVLLGAGDGSFGPARDFAAGNAPDSVAVADLNGDGKPDVVVADTGTVDVTTGQAVGAGVSVLLGDGSGSLGAAARDFAVGRYPSSVAVADVNGDGRPDLVVANGALAGTVSVLLSNGDGSFGAARDFAAGPYPTAVAVADVNGDGRPDLVVANRGTVDVTTGQMVGAGVSVLLGDGSGSFGAARHFAAGNSPSAVAVADVNGDGIPDLVVANGPTLDVNTGQVVDAGKVSVLLGDGHGSFGAARDFAAGNAPSSVAVADVNGDGIPDLVVADAGTFDANTGQVVGSGISVLLGDGHGSFGAARDFAAGNAPDSVAVADLNGDGIPDLVVANAGTFDVNTGQVAGAGVSVLLGDGSGSFGTAQHFTAGASPSAVAVADVNGDGIPDLVVANGALAGTVSVLLGDGHGSFDYRNNDPNQGTFTVGAVPQSVAVADVSGDGKPDVVVANFLDGTVSVLLGDGSTFTPATPLGGVGLRDTPLLADLDGDGLPDSVVLDRSGNILFRKGLPGSAGLFAPPVILNPGRPARDLALVHTGSGWAVAAADRSPDPILSSPGHAVYTVSLYAVAPGGSFVRSTAFATDILPDHIAAADLNGDGLTDLVLTSSLGNSVQVGLQQPDGTFGPPITLPVGVAPSDIAFVGRTDADGVTRPDIVVSDQVSGDVAVLLNDATHSFATSYRFRAGTGPAGITAGAALDSRDQPVSLAAGDFTGDGIPDLVVVDRGDHSLDVLPGNGHGGFANPQAALTTSTDGFDAGGQPLINDQPGSVVAGDFNGDGKLDLAVLMLDRAQVWVYLGNGDGTFTHTRSDVYAAGSGPTGLSAVTDGTTGRLDLLVGDGFGDILTLLGKGDGTFQPPPSLTGSRVSLTFPITGPDGQPEILVANQQTNQVMVETLPPGGNRFVPVTRVTDTGPDTLLAPGAIQLADLEGGNSPYPDVVVIGSGSNDVFVYRITGFNASGQPVFAAPEVYAVGTDPVGVTVQDINGDGIPDLLVVNRGSNDISVLFGGRDAAGHWVASLGPRLSSGAQLSSTGQGPESALVLDYNGDGIPDLLVTNSASGTVSVLLGRGQGYFDDQPGHILSLPAGAGAQQSLVGDFNGDGRLDLVTLDAGAGPAGNLTFFSDFLDPAGRQVTTLSSGGDGPVAAVQGDFNGDGIADLVVANNGDGHVTLLLGGANGPAVSEVLASPAGPHPTDLALGSSFGQVYVTSAGVDAAEALTFYDDYGNTIAQAQPLTTLLPGGMSISGDVNYTGDRDMFRFTPSQTGAVVIHETQGDVGANSLLAFDGSQHLIGSTSGTDLLEFPVVAGETFFFEVTGSVNNDVPVPYDLTLSFAGPDEPGFQVQTPEPPEVNPPEPPGFLAEEAPEPSPPPGPPEVETPVVIILPEPPPGEPVAESTSPNEAPLVLVVTLVAADLPEGEVASAQPAQPGAPVPAPEAGELPQAEAGPAPAGAEALAQARGDTDRFPDGALSATAGVGGDGEGDTGPQGGALPPGQSQLGPGWDDALREQDLYRSTEDGEPYGPVSSGDRPPLPDGWWGRVVAGLWLPQAEGLADGPVPGPGTADRPGPPAPTANAPGATAPRLAGASNYLVWLEGLAGRLAAERDGPAGGEQPRTRPSAGPEAAPDPAEATAGAPAAATEPRVVEPPLPERRLDLYQACLTAAAVGGLTWWVRERRAVAERPGEAPALRGRRGRGEPGGLAGG